MKIDKAIKILSYPDSYMKGQLSRTLEEAVKLGIEALKRVQLQRKIWGMEKDSLLLGETQ